MTVLISDSFNRADSATSVGTTDSYNGGTNTAWGIYGPTANLPTYGISSNQAYMVSNNGGFTNGQFSGINVGKADVTYTITLATGAAACYFVLRASAYNVYLMVATGNPITLKSYNAGTFLTLGTAGVASASGDVISVVLSGSTITVNKNGTAIITTTSTFNQTSTIFGFSGQGSTSNRFDNFQIEDLGSTVNGSATLQAVGTLTASGTATINGSANLQGVGSLTASGTATINGAATLQGVATLTASGTMNINGSANLQGVGTLTASGGYPIFGSAMLQAVGTLTASGVIGVAFKSRVQLLASLPKVNLLGSQSPINLTGSQSKISLQASLPNPNLVGAL